MLCPRVSASRNEAETLCTFGSLGVRQAQCAKGRASVKGFLGTWASFSADLNLVVQIAMGIALLAGAFLARAKRYAAHGACQAAVLILNLPMIALVMWPSFHVRVLPRLAGHFGKRYYAIAAIHGVL